MENDMGLVELMGEKHTVLRKRSEALWNSRNSIKMTASEWYVLTRVGSESTSIAQVARQAEMTRQAAHKYIRILAQKGLLELGEQEGNRRDKHVWVSDLGHRCLAEYNRMQGDLERQIVGLLGEEDMAKMRELLSRPWITEV